MSHLPTRARFANPCGVLHSVPAMARKARGPSRSERGRGSALASLACAPAPPALPPRRALRPWWLRCARVGLRDTSRAETDSATLIPQGENHERLRHNTGALHDGYHLRTGGSLRSHSRARRVRLPRRMGRTGSPHGHYTGLLHHRKDAVAPDGTQLADERESLLWGFVNMLDAQTRRLDRAADRLLPGIRDLPARAGRIRDTLP